MSRLVIPQVEIKRRRGFSLRSDQISLEVGVAAVVGPNGAGKSTWVMAVAEALQATTPIAVVRQHPLLPRGFRVRELVEYVAWLKGSRGVAVGRQAQGVLDAVDLGDRAGSSVGDLSGGMQRRLVLACALIGRPSVLVLDEATESLDIGQKERFWHAVRRSDVSHVIAVLHDPSEVASVADWIVPVRMGRVGEPLAAGPDVDDTVLRQAMVG